MFIDGEREERKRTESRKRTYGIEVGPLLHSLSYWVSVYSVASYTLAIPKGEVQLVEALLYKPEGREFDS
jgi:hypothetical protein